VDEDSPDEHEESGKHGGSPEVVIQRSENRLGKPQEDQDTEKNPPQQDRGLTIRRSPLAVEPSRCRHLCSLRKDGAARFPPPTTGYGHERSAKAWVERDAAAMGV
jgi:hypothetical protein